MGKTYDNGGPALWSRYCRHTDFTRRLAPVGKWVKDGRDLGLARRSGTGNLIMRPSAAGFPMGLPSLPYSSRCRP